MKRRKSSKGKFQATRICSHCGQHTARRALFCQKCGRHENQRLGR